MNAEQAFKLTSENLPEIENKEYNSMIKSIELFAKRGKFSFTMSTLPSNPVMERLQSEGYRFYSCSGFPSPMTIYTIKWNMEDKLPKKKWFQKIFKQ